MYTYCEYILQHKNIKYIYEYNLTNILAWIVDTDACFKIFIVKKSLSFDKCADINDTSLVPVLWLMTRRNHP